MAWVWVLEEPIVLELGGRRDVFEASGVLFRLPMMLLAMASFVSGARARVGQNAIKAAASNQRGTVADGADGSRRLDCHTQWSSKSLTERWNCRQTVRRTEEPIGASPRAVTRKRKVGSRFRVLVKLRAVEATCAKVILSGGGGPRWCLRHTK